MSARVQLFPLAFLIVATLRASAFSFRNGSHVSASLHPGNITGPSKPVNDTIVIELSEAPRRRWKQAAARYKAPLQALIPYLVGQLPDFLQKNLRIFEDLVGDATGVLPEPYKDEIRGIAEVAEVPAAFILVANLYYELHSGCTGVIAVDFSTNATIHGRNLDYNIPGLQNLTANVEFRSNGTLLARGTTYVGYLGLLTGASPMGFSVQLNERDTKNGSEWSNLLEALFKGGRISGYFLRNMLISGVSYTEALELAQTTHLITPSYLILAGPHAHEAAIVTRERDSAVDTLSITDAQNPYKWFLVQTNYDHWEPAPPSDDRRDATAANMRALGPGRMDPRSLFSVMSIWPTQNSDTTYTTIMASSFSARDPLSGVYFSYTRNN